MPTTDDTLRVKLEPHRGSHHARSGEKKAVTSPAGQQTTPQQPPTGETLPNPY
jgi:hypothetical protein